MSGPDGEKFNQTHMEYSHGDAEADHASHTPKELEQPAGAYMHKGTAFEKKLLRRIDLRLVPVLCKYESTELDDLCGC